MALALAIIGVLVGIALGRRFKVFCPGACDRLGRDICANSRTFPRRQLWVNRLGHGDSWGGYSARRFGWDILGEAQAKQEQNEVNDGVLAAEASQPRQGRVPRLKFNGFQGGIERADALPLPQSRWLLLPENR
jgi:hypothetical protein